jgi:hypothetical protein
VSPHGNLLVSLRTSPSPHALQSRDDAVACLAELHRLEVMCATNNNIVQRIILTNNACPDWREVIEIAITQSQTLKNCSVQERKLGWHKFTIFRLVEYEYLLGALYCDVMETRRHYMKFARKQLKFVTVGHGIWNSDQKKILGVTVYSGTTQKNRSSLPLILIY